MTEEQDTSNLKGCFLMLTVSLLLRRLQLIVSGNVMHFLNINPYQQVFVKVPKKRILDWPNQQEKRNKEIKTSQTLSIVQSHWLGLKCQKEKVFLNWL